MLSRLPSSKHSNCPRWIFATDLRMRLYDSMTQQQWLASWSSSWRMSPPAEDSRGWRGCRYRRTCCTPRGSLSRTWYRRTNKQIYNDLYSFHNLSQSPHQGKRWKCSQVKKFRISKDFDQKDSYFAKLFIEYGTNAPNKMLLAIQAKELKIEYLEQNISEFLENTILGTYQNANNFATPYGLRG